VSLAGLTALVVDDNGVNRELFTGLLSRWGMSVRSFPDGKQALAEMERSAESGMAPAMLLTDVCMPGMDGWELAKRVRADRNLAQVRIIVMPSAGMRGDARKCRELGLEGYLTKPVVMEELNDTLLAVMAGRQALCAGPVTRHSVREGQCRCQVLVVDDVEINREMVRIALEKRGHAVEMADNGRRAVDACLRGDYDLVFMDMQMPEMDGYTAIGLIREAQRQQGVAPVPIVAMTAYALSGDRERCIHAGADEYLAKPAKPAEILQMVERFARNVVTESAGVCTGPAPDREVAEAATTVSREHCTDLVFDRGALLERIGGREEMVTRLLGLFCRNMIGYLAELSRAVSTGDREQVRIQAHAIKGAAANIAALKVNSRAPALEAAAREGKAEAFTVLQGELDAEFAIFSDLVHGGGAGQAAAAESTDGDRSFPATVPAIAADSPVWDRTGLVHRLLADESLVEMIVRSVQTVLPDYIDQLQQALDRGDLKLVEMHAHTIKGASANVGGERLRLAAGIVESAAERGDLARARAVLGLVNDEAQRLLSSLSMVSRSEHDQGQDAA
jgi:CheY-like chemotaxis protein/HPt (histidine-containing phosphotransfer) domain-containing protein